VRLLAKFTIGGIVGGAGYFGVSGIHNTAIALGELAANSGRDALSRIAEYETGRSIVPLNTQKAATERQRGMEIIRNSRLNARNMFGTEASMFHK
jgi:hypothetical protein